MALGLALGSAVTLVADLDALRGNRADLSAAQRAYFAGEAVRLAPWRADYRRDFAGNLWDDGDHEASVRQLAAALRYAPADPALWAQYEFELALSAPQDPRVPRAAERVAALGPNQPELQQAQANLAVQAWLKVGPEVRQIWLHSLRYALARDHDGFLLRSFRVGGETNLCSSAAALGIQQWCGYARQARMFCALGDLPPLQAQQCINWGAIRAPAAAGGLP